MWMDLEGIQLKWNKSTINIIWYHLCVESKKIKQTIDINITQTEADSQIQRTNYGLFYGSMFYGNYGYQCGGGVGGTNCRV